MVWDWSAAGRMGPDASPWWKGRQGYTVYDSKKVPSCWRERHPEYVWFNGEVKYTLLGDKIEKGLGYVPINRFGGSPNDGKSRIWPVKVFRGVQPYDPVNQTLVVPHTTAPTGAYGVSFNGEKRLRRAWRTPARLSQQGDFIKTKCCGRSPHGRAAFRHVACNECHSKNAVFPRGG